MYIDVIGGTCKMGKMSIEVSGEDGKRLIKISGSIDEDSAFTEAKLEEGEAIVLDLEGVASINSCGIREWINWFKTTPGVKAEFKNCPKIIVDQINMVSGFLPEDGKVDSFYVPYYSDESGVEKMILFKSGEHFTGGEVNAPDTIKDEATGEEMEMDVIESKYFRFLKK